MSFSNAMLPFDEHYLPTVMRRRLRRREFVRGPLLGFLICIAPWVIAAAWWWGR